MLARPYFKVPDFILYKLPGANIAEPIKLAFEFLILTAARTNEVIYANPDEIADDTWTIPGKRMKAGRPHKVPLPARSVEIVKRAKEIGRGDYIFPGRIKGKPLSNMAFLMALRRMGVDTTAHGFRSSFRDWAAEETNFPREVCEMALAHLLTTKQLVKEIASWLPRSIAVPRSASPHHATTKPSVSSLTAYAHAQRDYIAETIGPDVAPGGRLIVAEITRDAMTIRAAGEL